MDPYLDLKHFGENYLKIITKKNSIINLGFNVFQERVYAAINELKKAGKPVRIIVLKARQLGISTFATSYIYHESITNFYTKSTVIADDVDNTNNLFLMVKRFYDFSPDYMRPMSRYSNEKALVFENPDMKTRAINPGLLSSIHLETSNKMTAGRSGTILNLHCSEFAFWAKAGIVVSGLFQAVPFTPNSSIIIESTANGVSGRGEEFYNKWKSAESGRGDFIPLFFPWFENDEYVREVPRDFTIEPEEQDLMERHPLIDIKKIAWRRYKIQNEMGSALISPLDQFRQEYPSNPREAFISTGRPVFNIDQIESHIEQLNTVSFKEGIIDSFGKFIEQPRGPYKLFLPVQEGKVYALGADVAEGLESGDFSTQCGLNREYQQVFSYHGHIAADSFGREICIAGKMLNNCLVCPEVNNHGLTTLTKIKDLSYPMIFTREVEDEISHKLTPKLGWQTNRKTKMLMLDDFVSLYRDGILKLYDQDLLKEMATLTVETDGDVELGGKDRVVAVCLAIQCLKQAPFENTYAAIVPGQVPKEFKSLDEKLKYLNRRKRDSQF